MKVTPRVGAARGFCEVPITFNRQAHLSPNTTYQPHVLLAWALLKSPTMTAKRKLTMYCTPTMKRKLHALAKQSGCSMDFFIEAWFRFAICHFDGKITGVLKFLLHQEAKSTKEKHSVQLTVWLAPEVYEGLQRLQSRTGAAVRARLRRTEMPCR